MGYYLWRENQFDLFDSAQAQVKFFYNYTEFVYTPEVQLLSP